VEYGGGGVGGMHGWVFLVFMEEFV
jgi:hypothetical protein